MFGAARVFPMVDLVGNTMEDNKQTTTTTKNSRYKVLMMEI